MPISAKDFKKTGTKTYWNAEIAKHIEEFLKKNKDKAYSAVDLQVQFKIGYGLVTQSIRYMKKKECLEWKWFTESRRKTLYYHYIEPKVTKK